MHAQLALMRENNPHKINYALSYTKDKLFVEGMCRNIEKSALDYQDQTYGYFLCVHICCAEFA